MEVQVQVWPPAEKHRPLVRVTAEAKATSLADVSSPVWQLSWLLVSSGSSELLWTGLSHQDADSEEAPPHANGRTMQLLMAL